MNHHPTAAIYFRHYDLYQPMHFMFRNIENLKLLVGKKPLTAVDLMLQTNLCAFHDTMAKRFGI